MRYEKGRKDASRSRIMEVAAERFRSDGIAASGLAGIMNEAGLTNGAFYPHFQSKAELVRESVAAALEDQSDQMREAAGGRRPGNGHRGISVGGAPGQSGKGCASAALLPELARQPPETRQLYTERFLTLVRQMSAALPADQGPGRRCARHLCDAHRRASTGPRRRRDGIVGSHPCGGEGCGADADPAATGRSGILRCGVKPHLR